LLREVAGAEFLKRLFMLVVGGLVDTAPARLVSVLGLLLPPLLVRAALVTQAEAKAHLTHWCLLVVDTGLPVGGVRRNRHIQYAQQQRAAQEEVVRRRALAELV
jgi:hypothetical protein